MMLKWLNTNTPKMRQSKPSITFLGSLSVYTDDRIYDPKCPIVLGLGTSKHSLIKDITFLAVKEKHFGKKLLLPAKYLLAAS